MSTAMGSGVVCAAHCCGEAPAIRIAPTSALLFRLFSSYPFSLSLSLPLRLFTSYCATSVVDEPRSNALHFTLYMSSLSHSFSTLLQGRRPLSHVLQIHAQIIVSGAHQENLIATRLIGHYQAHFSLRVFNQLRKPNIFPFNAIIRVLAEQGLASEAFAVFLGLKRQLLSPNDFTFCFLLKACLSFEDSVPVKQVHTQLVKEGLITDPFVCNGLLNVYAKGAKDLASAHELFDEMSDRGKRSMVCCWTSLISGFAKSRESDKALRLFLGMISEGLRPDGETMVSVLSACASLKDEYLEKWVDVLSHSVGDGSTGDFRSDSIHVVLTYLYGKLGNIEKSRKSFDKIVSAVKRNVVTWNAMMNAYVQNGCVLEALELFLSMNEDPHLCPNHVTLVSALAACAQVGDIDLGRRIHEYIISKGQMHILQRNPLLATSLIDMYSKCGYLKAAMDVFNLLISKDIVSVNSMILGFAVNGEGDEALGLFYMIPKLGLRSNLATFLSVLYACCHSGMLEKGKEIFQDMKANYFPPQLEHYACYVDLLSRVGLIDDALEVVRSMPFEPNNFVWGAILCGCILHSRAELAENVSTKLVEADPENSAGYVMLSNSLAFDRQWDEVIGLRGAMRDKGVKKHPGCSWININGDVQQFLAGLSPSREMDCVYYILDLLDKEMRISERRL